MDKKSPPKKQLGVTPAKLIVIGVLSLVLVAILYLQFSSSPTTSASAVTAGPARHRPSGAAPAAVADNSDLSTPEQASSGKPDFSSNWQAADLSKVVQHDPFATPASFPQRLKAGAEDKLAQETAKTVDAKAEETARADAIKAMQSQFVQLQHEGVHVIMEQHDKYVALVGDRTIHVGDQIEGFTVVAIDADGVRVARDLKQ
ncbi:MAG TPA: hypothetical protein VGM76_03865 [Lacipirellulaceae bacterium]|jgi:hypothetical protein